MTRNERVNNERLAARLTRSRQRGKFRVRWFPRREKVGCCYVVELCCCCCCFCCTPELPQTRQESILDDVKDCLTWADSRKGRGRRERC